MNSSLTTRFTPSGEGGDYTKQLSSTTPIAARTPTTPRSRRRSSSSRRRRTQTQRGKNTLQNTTQNTTKREMKEILAFGVTAAIPAIT